MTGAVSKFGLVFYAKTDDALAGMARMQKTFGNMEAALVSLQGTASHVFQSLKNSLFGWGKTLVDSAAKIESTKALFQFAFRDLPDKGAAAFDKSVDAGLRMVQTTDEVINMVTLMQRMAKVNVFDPKIEKTMAAVNKQGLQLIDVLGDMASINRYGMQGVAIALSEAMTGQWRSFQMRLDIGKKEVEEYKKATNKAKDATEKMAIMAPLLYKRFGGAAASMSNTWKFLASQIDDYRDKLFSTFGNPLMEALKPSLAGLNKYMTDPQTGLVSKARIHELDQIVGIFKTFGGYLASVVSMLGTSAKYVITFVKAHPDVLKWAVGVAALTTAFAGLVTTLIAAKLASVAVAVAFGSMTTPILLLLGALTAGGVALAQWAVQGKSLADTWNKWAAVAAVVSDVLTTMNGKVAKINIETAKAAEAKGVLGLAIKLGMFAYRVKEFFVSTWDGLRKASGEIRASFLPVFSQLTEMAGAFGGSATSGTERWRQAGTVVASILTKLIKGFAWLLDFSLRFYRAFKGTLTVIGGLIWYGILRPIGHLLNYLDIGWTRLQSWLPILKGVKVGFADILGVAAGIGVAMLGAKKLAGAFGVDLMGTLKRAFGKGGPADALAGVQKVFVVNMPGGLGGGGLLGPGALPGAAAGAAAGKAGLLAKAGTVAVAFAGGWALGDLIANLKDKSGRTLAEAIGDKMFEWFGPNQTPMQNTQVQDIREGKYGPKAAETQKYLDSQNDQSVMAKILRQQAGDGKVPTYDPDISKAWPKGPVSGGPTATQFVAVLKLDGKQVAAAVAKQADLEDMKGAPMTPLQIAR